VRVEGDASAVGIADNHRDAPRVGAEAPVERGLLVLPEALGVAGAVFATRGYPTSALLAAGVLLLVGIVVLRFLPEPPSAAPSPPAHPAGVADP